VMYRGNYHILLSYFAYILKSNRFDGNNRLVFGSIFYSGDINSLLAKTHSGKSKSDEEMRRYKMTYLMSSADRSELDGLQ